MATNNADQITGGYDCTFICEPPDDLKCQICLLVVRDPQQHSQCGKVFCNYCITEYKRRNGILAKCPNCRGSDQRIGSTSFVTFSDGRSDREVKSLRVQCTNKGCSWSGELRDLQDHSNECGYLLVDCPNDCGPIKISRRNLKTHLTSKCPKRAATCPHCKAQGEHKEITTTHIEQCPKVKVTCTNEGCEQSLLRCELLDHQAKVCEFQEVHCKYKSVGCQEKCIRKDLKKHEGNAQRHLRCTVETVLKLQEELSRKNDCLPRIIRLENFEDKMINSVEFFSSSFYTSYSGYRMQLIIYANGEADDAHVSVFVCILQGVNDDKLKWPFTGTVVVELLNQQQDAHH